MSLIAIGFTDLGMHNAGGSYDDVEFIIDISRFDAADDTDVIFVE